MERVAKFYKVSLEQFKKDFEDVFEDAQIWEYLCTCGLIPFHFNKPDGCEINEAIQKIYNRIQLPQRATNGSAGYDFYLPFDVSILKNDAVKIPTGIRCEMKNGWVLKIYPRSGHGFKHGIHLANTVGIIDSDYFDSNNEGHIMVKLVNDSILNTNGLQLKAGTAFCQGIFLPFGITTDDECDAKRNGGFGSTDK